MTKLFVGGFPLDMSELEIVQIVAMYANVVTIKIVRDKKTKICKGYAFLEIADRESAELAVDELNGEYRAGRKLKLSIVEEPPAEPIVKQKRPRLASKV
jgi:RNA recognition motif-containing protein